MIDMPYLECLRSVDLKFPCLISFGKVSNQCRSKLILKKLICTIHYSFIPEILINHL